MKYYNCGKPGYIKRNCRQSSKINQYIGYAQATQNISKTELEKILKQVSSPIPIKQLTEKNFKNISDYKLVDNKEYINIQIRDWQLIIIKNKKKAPMTPDSIKSEEIN